ncbi:V-type ATP synthase subunit D [Catenulispora subtropica]|uniref:H+transporting two-sector ATPase D subunit n=1 Tax=Catenulispora subtropica TaxID=450798 RepID=A0ABN2RLR7_9ACTN
MTTLRIPPGRAGRLRLMHRLAVAERGADLLEQKLRALIAELADHRAALDAADREWRTLADRARAWDDRAAVLGGRRPFDAAVPPEPARVAVTWRTSMGIRFPAAAETEIPERPPDLPVPGGAALLAAEAAFREAVPAAARVAVERAAVRNLEDAVAATRRQAGALRRHWIPTLSAALAGVEAALEQTDHEDTVRRTAWAWPGPSALPGSARRTDADSEEASSHERA